MTALLGLELTPVEAIDAGSASPDQVETRFAKSGALGEISRGDKCCTLSHRIAWEELVASGDDYAVVLEDDAVLSDSAGWLLLDHIWIPSRTDLIKLEHFGAAGQRILVSDFATVAPGFQLARLRSRHTGTGGYILSRRGALKLLALERFDLPVDHLLFNPNTSPLFAALAPQQLIPAVLRQRDFAGLESDIEIFRKEFRKFNCIYAKREMLRLGYELRLLPAQVAAALSGRAKFITIATE